MFYYFATFKMISVEQEKHPDLVPLPPIEELVSTTKDDEFLAFILRDEPSIYCIIDQIIPDQKCKCVDVPSPTCSVCQSYIQEKRLKHRIIQRKYEQRKISKGGCKQTSSVGKKKRASPSKISETTKSCLAYKQTSKAITKRTRIHREKVKKKQGVSTPSSTL